MRFHFPRNVLWTNGIKFVSVFPGNGSTLFCLFIWLLLVHVISWQTAAFCSLSYSYLHSCFHFEVEFWTEALFWVVAGRDTAGKPHAGKHAATCSFVEWVAPGTALAAHLLLRANKSPSSSMQHKTWLSDQHRCHWKPAELILNHSFTNRLFTHNLLHIRLNIRKNISSLKGWSGIGVSCPGKWFNHHLWNCSKNI